MFDKDRHIPIKIFLTTSEALIEYAKDKCVLVDDLPDDVLLAWLKEKDYDISEGFEDVVSAISSPCSYKHQYYSNDKKQHS